MTGAELSIRGLPDWLIREYFAEMGAAPASDGGGAPRMEAERWSVSWTSRLVSIAGSRGLRLTQFDIVFSGEAEAVEYAQRNAELNGIGNCRTLLSDGFGALPEELRLDVVASNLPAKAGNEAYYILFAGARDRLVDGGRLYVVTLSGQRRFVARAFREVFGNYEKVKQGRTHTVSLAMKEPSGG